MIQLVCGPMFSGKTSHLFMWERKSKIAKKTVCYVKHSIDTRYNQDHAVIVNHDGEQSGNSPVFATDSLISISSKLESFDVILIDEGQFFKDLLEFCKQFVGKTIIISALSGDYKQEPFKPVSEIIAFCDRVLQICATCVKCGDDAPFTSRLIQSEDKILVGGKETYEPRCRKCFV